MPIARINGKLVYFAHVPKAAGSAVERYLVDRFGQPAFRNQRFLRLPAAERWTRTSPQHVDVQALELLFPEGFFDAVFAVVRHPVTRLRSVFQFQRDLEQTLPAEMGFTEWLKALPAAWADDPFMLDNHPRPMCQIVPAGAEVFHLEAGLAPVVTWLNTQAGGAGGAKEIGRFNVLEARLKHEGRPYRPVTPSAEDVALIAEQYAEDFDRFGYHPDQPGGPAPRTSPVSKTGKPMQDPIKILVFGKTGQVATELAARADITALGRDEADLSDPAACAAAIAAAQADVVINAAAYTAVDRAEEEEALAGLVNGDAPTAMALAAAKKGIPFVHISTDYVFDGSGETPWTPSDPTGPLGAYGRTKLKGEEGVRAAGGVHAILRTSWVFSAHGGNFVKTMLRLGKERDALTIVADQVGGPTAAGDIAEACLEIARQLVAGQGESGTYHFSGGPDVSWADFARAIFARAGLDVEVTDIPSSAYPTPAARPGNSRMECSDLTRAFGIARPDWRKSLDNVLQDLGEI